MNPLKYLTICFVAVVVSMTAIGCANKETKVIEQNGKATEIKIQGSISTVKVETVEIEGVEYLILHDENNQRFAICPKVNGKHAK